VPDKKIALYRTSDIYFSAYLMALDVPLKTTEKETGGDGGRKVVFVFVIPEGEIGRLKAQYFGGSGTVRARRFVDNLRNLKSMCFA
jgi:hypothetical protein